MQPDPRPGDRTGRATAGRRGRWASMAERTVPVAGLLPLRAFLGITYLYAGIDKFISPHFFVTDDPFSVAAQMAGYAQTSPLAPLIQAAMPAAIQVGFLIALAELAVGFGVLTGLSYRLAAGAGAALSLLFWLTSSWSTTPYFFSPDLPYAFGFLALALVGHGGLFVVGIARNRATGAAAPGVDGGGAASPESSGRRSVLQLGILAGLTVVLAGLLGSLRLLGSGTSGGGSAAASTAPGSPAPTSPPATAAPTPAPASPAAPSATPPDAPTPAPPTAAPTAAPATAAPVIGGVAGPVIGSVADFDSRNGIPFQVPFEALGNLNPGGPGIMVKLGDGSVVAYSAVCTHGRCTVGWDASTSIMQCPCHTARFDPANRAAVLSGPAPSPLPPIPVAVDEAGKVHMTAVR